MKGSGDNFAISDQIWFKFQMEFVCDSPIRINVVEITFGTFFYLGSGLLRDNVLENGLRTT